MKSTTFTFKPLHEEDLGLLHAWFHKPHVQQWYARNEDYTPQMIAEKYLPRVQDAERVPNFIIYADDRAIGYIQLYKVSYSLPDGVGGYDHPLFANCPPAAMAGVDMFIAEEAYLGKGYATSALQQFIEEHVKAKYKMLVVDPLKTNQHAIRFFERNGFKKFESDSSQSMYELLIQEITS